MITLRILLSPGRRGRIVVIVALLLPFCAPAAIPKDWFADVSRPSIAPFAVKRGETAALRCTLVRDGKPWDPAAVSATLYWQTNGMGDVWWSAAASVSSNVLSAVWTPDMDPGASPVSLFIGAVDAGGEIVYAAEATLRFLHAPGAVPNELPLPARVIDFATVSVTNALWALPSDIDSAIAAIDFPEPDYSETNAVLVATIQSVAPAPGNYATVSNLAMHAVQDESDPTIHSWAKAPQKPSYTASEVGALSENLLMGICFDFSTNAGLYLAVSNFVSALGGSITNFPSIP